MLFHPREPAVKTMPSSTSRSLRACSDEHDSSFVVGVSQKMRISQEQEFDHQLVKLSQYLTSARLRSQ